MSRGSERFLTGVAIAALLGAAYVVRKYRNKPQIERSERPDQEAPGGEPIEDEWGKESFPASDPPQSW